MMTHRFSINRQKDDHSKPGEPIAAFYNLCLAIGEIIKWVYCVKYRIENCVESNPKITCCNPSLQNLYLCKECTDTRHTQRHTNTHTTDSSIWQRENHQILLWWMKTIPLVLLTTNGVATVLKQSRTGAVLTTVGWTSTSQDITADDTGRMILITQNSITDRKTLRKFTSSSSKVNKW